MSFASPSEVYFSVRPAGWVLVFRSFGHWHPAYASHSVVGRVPEADFEIDIRTDARAWQPRGSCVFRAHAPGAATPPSPWWAWWRTDRNLWLVWYSAQGEAVCGVEFRAGCTRAQLWLYGAQGARHNILSWPFWNVLQQAIVQHLGGALIHASGVWYRGVGWLFLGVSGSGKSTIAKLLQDAGGQVLHDDTVLLRPQAGVWQQFSPSENPAWATNGVCIDRVLVLAHEAQNQYRALRGAVAVAHIAAQIVHHGFDTERLHRTFWLAQQINQQAVVGHLGFRPEAGVVGYLDGLIGIA